MIAGGPLAGPPVAAPPVALYVHIPFCVSLCPYCDFVVYAGAAARGPKARVGPFLGALDAELELRADVLDERFGRDRPPLETVYLGGGHAVAPARRRPSRELLARIRERFGLADGAEVTLEANPGPDERGDAGQWRAAGVTRLSLGAQSLSDPELRRLGRRHRSADVATAVREARDAGIASVSLDLLYDVPESTETGWAATLDAALALEPDHLSLYALTLDDPDAEGLTGPAGDHLPTTAGARRWRSRARQDQDEDRAAAQYVHATQRLARAGWRGLRDQQLGAARPRIPAQPRLLGATAVRGRRTGRPRVRRPDPPLERGPARRVPVGAGARRRRMPAVRGCRRAVRRRSTPRPQPPSRSSWRFGPIAASPSRWRVEGTSTEIFERARVDGLVAVAGDDRLVLTTRGRLLSNELFARLV